ncbi:class I SAM-dependent methyltransferase [Ktedonobacteria bacterium brp13]|nr:class I SAM-dependent methyltransferase [Ktedonobacteria bacterium brp13]
MPETVIQDLFDIERMAAFYRASENERVDAHIHDTYAHLLIGERGEQLMKELPAGLSEGWGNIARTWIYDDILLRIIQEQQVDVVLNLAAGLDTRPYRLALPATLRWVEADHAEILAYKAHLLSDAQPSCQLEQVPLAITDTEACAELLQDLGKQARTIFVLTEGLLIYLSVEQVSALAAALKATPAVQWWLTECIAPTVLQSTAQLWNPLAAVPAQVRFTPPGGVSFFYAYDWKVLEFYQYAHIALRLHLPLRRRWQARLFSWWTTKRRSDALYNTGGFFLFQRNPRSDPGK